MPELTAATVSRRADRMVLTYEIDGDLPSSGTWLLSTTITGGEDGPIHQFGVKAHDGRITDTFVFDHVATHQYNYPRVVPDCVGSKWTVAFPIESHDVSETGRWHATLNIDGSDVNDIDGRL